MDAPAPRYEDYWSKPGYSAQQVRDIFYGQCGFVEKEALGNDVPQWLRIFAGAEACMIDLGFIYNDAPKGGWGKCDQKIYRDFASCKSVR